MFSKPPAYTDEELNNAVKRIADLTALQDKAESMFRLTKQDQYRLSYERLTQNIATSQLYYQKMVEKMGGKL